MENCLKLQSNNRIMGGGEEEEEEVDSGLSSSDISSNSSVSSLSDFMDDATSANQLPSGPLDEMSSLIQQLPFKRGLSKHYHGKSQTFSSFTNLRCIHDLAKPENPYKKKLKLKLKSCKSYGGLLESHKAFQHKTNSGSISKKTPRPSFYSLNARRSSFGSHRSPIPPQKPKSLSNQTPFFLGRVVENGVNIFPIQ